MVWRLDTIEPPATKPDLCPAARTPLPGPRRLRARSFPAEPRPAARAAAPRPPAATRAPPRASPPRAAPRRAFSSARGASAAPAAAVEGDLAGVLREVDAAVSAEGAGPKDVADAAMALALLQARGDRRCALVGRGQVVAVSSVGGRGRRPPLRRAARSPAVVREVAVAAVRAPIT